MKFEQVNIGEHFTYGGDLFVKTSDGLAWEIRGGRRYKEWAFIDDDSVVVKEYSA